MYRERNSQRRVLQGLAQATHVRAWKEEKNLQTALNELCVKGIKKKKVTGRLVGIFLLFLSLFFFFFSMVFLLPGVSYMQTRGRCWLWRRLMVKVGHHVSWNIYSSMCFCECFVTCIMFRFTYVWLFASINVTSQMKKITNYTNSRYLKKKTNQECNAQSRDKEIN